MNRIEKAFIGGVFGAVPSVAGFLAGWWISIPLVRESHVFLYALAGLLAGIIVDAVCLGAWIRRAYAMKPIAWMAVYGFYSVGMFGFFMGVPVFHVALALPAGFFIGGWLARGGADSERMRKVARKTAVFTTSMLALVCVASATIALISPSTASDLKGLLGLPFQITPAMIIGLILAGGALILSLQWWLTLKIVERAYTYFEVNIAQTGPVSGF